MDRDPPRFGTGLVLSRYDVSATADPGHIQNSLADGVRDTKVARRAKERSSMGHLAYVPGDHRELPVSNSLGAIVRKLMGMRVCGSWTEYRFIVCED